MILAWLAFFESLLAIALIGAGVIGAHFALTTPFLGFKLYVAGSAFALLAFVFGLIGYFMTLNAAKASARPRAVAGLVIGAIAFLPLLYTVLTSPKVPPINDITTDTQTPPEFTKAGELPPNQGRDMKYDPAKYSAAQHAGYPDLQALKVPQPPDAAFAAAQHAASMMPNWQVTNADPATHTIEGVSTSNLFRFQDDFVIQVRPGDGGGSLVEMRSKSRDGIGDLGVNYKRIKDFFAAMQSQQPSA
jgi:uncharacterized protein (DUF1499 family)